MIRSCKYILTALIPAVLCLSCAQERQPCLTPLTASMKMKTVRVAADNTVIDTAMTAGLVVAVTNSGLKGVVYSKSSTFTLSLSPLADSTIWYFATDTAAGSLFDTLIFRHDKYLKFISNACGYSYNFGLKEVATSHNFIDSVHIINSSVTNNVNTSHLQVFIHSLP
jgi:hypothetical protein